MMRDLFREGRDIDAARRIFTPTCFGGIRHLMPAALTGIRAICGLFRGIRGLWRMATARASC